MLNEHQIERYSRQLVLPFWGLAEQRALANSVIAVDEELLSAAVYLAAAGVGELRLFQFTSESQTLDLERQQLRTHLFGLNPDSRVSEASAIRTGRACQGPDSEFEGQAEKFFTHVIVKVLDADSGSGPEFARSLEGQGAHVVRWLVAENCVRFRDRRVELPASKLLSAQLTAGTIAASIIMQSIAGFPVASFPDRLPGNFGCSVG